MSAKYVLDACSVIAYLTKEEGADAIEKLIHEAIDGDSELLMHKLNFYEVYYDTLRSQGKETAEIVFGTFKKLPVTIIESISDELMVEAARIKTGHSISAADSFALATARLHGATLVTSDHHEFNPVEDAGEIAFLWIR